MAKCSLRFYEKSKLKPENNWCFDDIETYLATLTAFDVSDFQYQRFELEKEIRVDFTQNEQTISSAAKKYDYLRISLTINNTPIYYYYFITKTRQISESTIAYALRMDTLNTFKYDSTIGNNKYTLSKKTLVKREHKDRFDTSKIYITSKDNYYEGSTEPNTEPVSDCGYLLKVSDLLEMISTTRTYNLNVWHYHIHIYNGNNVLQHEWNCKGSLILDKFASQIYIQANDWDTNTPISTYLSSGSIILTLETHPIIGDAYTQFYNFIMDNFPRAYAKLVYARKVDEYQEGLSTQLFKKNEKTLYDLDEDRHWYVVYASANAVTSGASDTEAIYVNPVKTRIYSDDGYTLVTESAQEINLYADSILIPKFNNMPERIEISIHDQPDNLGEQYIVIGSNTFDFFTYSAVHVWRKNNSDVTFYKYKWFKRDNTSGEVTTSFESVTFYGIDTVRCYGDGNVFQNIPDPVSIQINSGSNSYSGTSDPWEEIDRSDSRLIKAFVFPYAPCEFLVGKEEFTNLPNGVSFSTDNVIELSQKIKFNYQKRFEIDVLKDLYIEPSEINAIAGQSRNKKYESKLYHSDYYQVKFVYDSFSFGFMYENVDCSEVISQYADIDTLYTTYVVSNNVQSKFMFQFDSYILKKSFQDYDNVLTIERNNEKALFNNAYINYIRSGGYSYDTKKASSQNAVNGVTTALTIVGSVGSFAAGFASGNPMGVAAGVGLAVGAITGIIRSVHTAQEQDRAITQKLMQTHMQATSVQGSEDIDILTAFSGNKAKIVYYELSDIMKQAMWDLFHYCGYATHEQKKPVTTGRLYFNFIQAEIIFESYNFNEDIADDIENKWNEGVTFFHAVSGAYDIDQQYENFETSLM